MREAALRRGLKPPPPPPPGLAGRAVFPRPFRGTGAPRFYTAPPVLPAAALASRAVDLWHAGALEGRLAHCRLAQPLLLFLAVVVGGRLLDLRLELRYAALDVLLLARAVDDGGVVVVDMDAIGRAQPVER